VLLNNHSKLRIIVIAVGLLSLPLSVSAQTQTRPATVAVLDFGDSAVGRLAAGRVAANLKLDIGLAILDRDQVGAAARGAGYTGSINLSLGEARELGAAMGCDFFVIGDAQTLRRSPSSGATYFESYASIFLVSARTGRLITWERPNFESPSSKASEDALLSKLSNTEIRQSLANSLRRALESERGERALISDSSVPLIEEAPDDDKRAEAEGLRLPRPYRRLVPAYPETAARAEAEATVDVFVDLDAEGEVTRVEVARWGGFGLDQATVDTVRRLRFFPAMREGIAIPIRVLLRYNFRKPPP
jgi:TonB family protein